MAFVGARGSPRSGSWLSALTVSCLGLQPPAQQGALDEEMVWVTCPGTELRPRSGQGLCDNFPPER